MDDKRPQRSEKADDPAADRSIPRGTDEHASEQRVDDNGDVRSRDATGNERTTGDRDRHSS